MPLALIFILIFMDRPVSSWISTISIKLSNAITSPQRHRRAQRFLEQKHQMISQGRNVFPCNVMQTNRVPEKLCQVKSHVQTAREPHDLNMDFCDFKQLCVADSYARISVFTQIWYVPNIVCCPILPFSVKCCWTVLSLLISENSTESQMLLDFTGNRILLTLYALIDSPSGLMQ